MGGEGGEGGEGKKKKIKFRQTFFSAFRRRHLLAFLVPSGAIGLGDPFGSIYPGSERNREPAGRNCFD